MMTALMYEWQAMTTCHIAMKRVDPAGFPPGFSNKFSLSPIHIAFLYAGMKVLATGLAPLTYTVEFAPKERLIASLATDANRVTYNGKLHSILDMQRDGDHETQYRIRCCETQEEHRISPSDLTDLTPEKPVELYFSLSCIDGSDVGPPGDFARTLDSLLGLRLGMDADDSYTAIEQCIRNQSIAMQSRFSYRPQKATLELLLDKCLPSYHAQTRSSDKASPPFRTLTQTLKSEVAHKIANAHRSFQYYRLEPHEHVDTIGPLQARRYRAFNEQSKLFLDLAADPTQGSKLRHATELRGVINQLDGQISERTATEANTNRTKSLEFLVEHERYGVDGAVSCVKVTFYPECKSQTRIVLQCRMQPGLAYIQELGNPQSNIILREALMATLTTDDEGWSADQIAAISHILRHRIMHGDAYIADRGDEEPPQIDPGVVLLTRAFVDVAT